MPPERRDTLLFRLAVTVGLLLCLWQGWNILALRATLWTVRQAPQGQASGSASTASAKAPLTIVEFMDYRCTVCRNVAPVVAQVAAAHPEIRFVYRQLPLYGAPSAREARLALAAGIQGKFMAMHNLLLAHAAPVETAEISSLCAQAGIDPARAIRDADSRAVTLSLVRTAQAARLLRMPGLPAFMIGDTVYNTGGGTPTVAKFEALITAAKR